MTIGISSFATAYVRARTAERMNDACRIWKPGPPVLDKVTGKTKRGEDILKYEGPCRFWEANAGSDMLLGDQKLVTSQTYLSLPFNAPVPESKDIVLITKSVDADLQGRTVTIKSVTRGGGLRASRKFLVQIVESSKENW